MVPSSNGRIRDFHSRNRGSIPLGTTIFRGVAQMEERLIWDQEAVGSRPATSTINNGCHEAE